MTKCRQFPRIASKKQRNSTTSKRINRKQIQNKGELGIKATEIKLTHQRRTSPGSEVVEEEGGAGDSLRREGRGLEPLMIQPRAKKERPARIAVPQA